MLRTLFLLICAALLLGGCYSYIVTRDLPSIDKMLREGVTPTNFTQIFAANGTPILSHGKFHHKDAALGDISPHFIDALLATEDRRFYQHPGVDPVAIARAVVQNIKTRRFSEGGSTLTQQLARNVFLSNERSLKRKVREAVLSFQLEQQLTKDQILTLYVNNIYFGEGAYGISAASEVYFNKRPSQLTVDEAALLAGMPQAPSSYSPFQNRDGAIARRNEVLENLYEVGKINKDDLERYKNARPNLNQEGQAVATADKAPFFNRFVIEEIRRNFDLDEQSFWQSGLKVYTTLDLAAQRVGERAVVNQSGAYGRTGKNQQAAMVSIDPKTGGILAYVGGKNYQQSQYDRVTQAIRSPGSLFKVFTYTTAIDHGFEPTKVYIDEPIQFGDWTPTNYDKAYHGPMTLAKALATSNNVIAVKLTNELGADQVANTAQRMGIQSKLNPYLAITLGGSGVNLLEITSAFGVLANQGVRSEPYAVDHILDDRGKLIYQHQPAQYDVLKRETVDTMVKMMMGVIQRGTGKAADIGRPAAAKTGTSDDWRDAWFIGFTPDVVTGVWVGNDDNSPMRGMTGGSLPASIWKSYMSWYLARKPISNFDLAYSKTLSDADFSTYNPENLSQEDLDNPPGDVQDAELQNEEPGTEAGDGSQELTAPPSADESRPATEPSLMPEPEHPVSTPGPTPTPQGYQVIPIQPERRNFQGLIPIQPPSPATSRGTGAQPAGSGR